MIKHKYININNIDASVVDVFCGVGGLSHGFKLAGFDVIAGIDIEEDCRYAYEKNNCAQFVRKDIRDIDGKFLKEFFGKTKTKILVGCAPCQPFSSYNKKNNSTKWQLLDEFLRLIEELGPEIVSMENVPDLVKFRKGELFQKFVDGLEKLGYEVSWEIVKAWEYGVPQNRKRLVLLASNIGKIDFISPVSKKKYPTVRDAIGGLEKIENGCESVKDPLHRSASLSKKNLKRIRHSKPGGSWKDWPKELIANCHKSHSGKTYRSVYGRMVWDEPSPTITTQFYGFGNGRFGHPEQDRAISVREGAILQSFPSSYSFIEPGKPFRITKLGKFIGNAVPVKLGEAVAISIKNHLERQYANVKN